MVVLYTSQLRILRTASTHCPVLGQLLSKVHSAIASHNCVLQIDQALNCGFYNTLMEITDTSIYFWLPGKNELDSKYEQCNVMTVNVVIQFLDNLI